MPFASRAQFRYMMAKHSDIAKRWLKEGHKMPKNEYADHVGKGIDVSKLFMEEDYLKPYETKKDAKNAAKLQIMSGDYH